MFRQVWTVALVVLAALGSLTPAITMPGCSKSPDTAKSDNATQEPGAASKTKVPPIQQGKALPEAAVGGETKEPLIQPGKATQEVRAGGETKNPPKELTVDVGNGVKLEMVLIPAGEFLMGSPEADKNAEDNERPQHRVRITRPFYLGKYLVTQEQWEAVMGNNPSALKGATNPVEQVSWEDCRGFVEKLNAKVGGGKFSLPTEAQWEYACRAGSTSRFCFGDDESGLGEYAWYVGHSDSKTHAVGEKKPNAWGLYDMYGNAWEWCADWYDGGYYAGSPTDNPTGPPEDVFRVARGGGWNDAAGCCRSAFRGMFPPGHGVRTLGFRIARVPADK